MEEENLDERVEQFIMMKLPGQPIAMHMGTSYLVNDLHKEVKRLRAEVESEMNRATQAEARAQQYRKSLHDLVREAQAYETRSKHLLAECQYTRQILENE